MSVIRLMTSIGGSVLIVNFSLSYTPELGLYFTATVSLSVASVSSNSVVSQTGSGKEEILMCRIRWNIQNCYSLFSVGVCQVSQCNKNKMQSSTDEGPYKMHQLFCVKCKYFLMYYCTRSTYYVTIRPTP